MADGVCYVKFETFFMRNRTEMCGKLRFNEKKKIGLEYLDVGRHGVVLNAMAWC